MIFVLQGPGARRTTRVMRSLAADRRTGLPSRASPSARRRRLRRPAAGSRGLNEKGEEMATYDCAASPYWQSRWPLGDRGGAPCAATKLDIAASSTWWGHVPIMLAIDNGYFKDQGLDVTLQNIGSRRPRRGADRGLVAFSNLGRSRRSTRWRAAIRASTSRQCRRFAGNEGCWAPARLRLVQGAARKKVAANTLGADHHERALWRMPG